jgi:aconitate hydratase
VQVDQFGSILALQLQRRAGVRAQPRALRVPEVGPEAFDNFRVVPPGTGIVHQVNLEYLAKGVLDGGPQRQGRRIPTRSSAPTATRR